MLWPFTCGYLKESLNEMVLLSTQIFTIFCEKILFISKHMPNIDGKQAILAYSACQVFFLAFVVIC